MNRSLLILLAATAGGVALAGCGSPAAEYRRYETFAHKAAQDAGIEKLKASQLSEVDDLLAAFYGTPDEPAIPAVEDADIASVLSLPLLQMAAGPVGSDEQGRPRGLYREHCAHCHGITGDGNGPTAAFLNPYPRDYRPGKFKFKSTPVGGKPTHADLKKVLLEGVAGTAMPSFKLLTDIEVEALTQYVIYLSLRGETERELIRMQAELDLDSEPNARLVNIVTENATDEERQLQQEQMAAVKEKIATVVNKWTGAMDASVEIPPRPEMTPEELVESRKLGRTLFYGSIANCVKCHGDSALGDGQLTDYDDWTKEFIGEGKDPEVVAQYVALGLPEPRNIRPRNLRMGIYRGGMRPIDIYWRIRNGIEGTPMPAATMKPDGDPNAKGLTPDDIWHIVNYIESLPYESISNPNDAAERALERMRM
ncbi:MAG: c-type cytochrome [Pirellulaceae bacterium]|nr:c-type cytochrome [Pirellulaceae bacterium]